MDSGIRYLHLATEDAKDRRGSLHAGPSQLRSLKVGFPIRRSPDQSLFAAPRGLSQRTTSFIASQRQGIHQMPFSHLIALIVDAHPPAQPFVPARALEHHHDRPPDPANTRHGGYPGPKTFIHTRHVMTTARSNPARPNPDTTTALPLRGKRRRHETRSDPNPQRDPDHRTCLLFTMTSERATTRSRQSLGS